VGTYPKPGGGVCDQRRPDCGGAVRGSAPNFVAGVYQINSRLPKGLTPGAAQVKEKIGDTRAPAW
jgi:hypothetical protein